MAYAPEHPQNVNTFFAFEQLTAKERKYLKFYDRIITPDCWGVAYTPSPVIAAIMEHVTQWLEDNGMYNEDLTEWANDTIDNFCGDITTPYFVQRKPEYQDFLKELEQYKK